MTPSCWLFAAVGGQSDGPFDDVCLGSVAPLPSQHRWQMHHRIGEPSGATSALNGAHVGGAASPGAVVAALSGSPSLARGVSAFLDVPGSRGQSDRGSLSLATRAVCEEPAGRRIGRIDASTLAPITAPLPVRAGSRGCGVGRSPNSASSFLFGVAHAEEEETHHAKICHYYPGEDPRLAVYQPPRPDERIHRVAPVWIHKIKKFYKIFVFLAYGITIGVVLMIGRALVFQHLGPPDWEGKGKSSTQKDETRERLARSQQETPHRGGVALDSGSSSGSEVGGRSRDARGTNVF